MQKWVNSLTKSSDKPRTVIIASNATGAGDKINLTPALREYKILNPDHEIILIADEFSSDVFKNNPNIDYLIPTHSITNWQKRKNEKIINLQWSFYDQHQYGHVCKSYLHYLIDDTDKNCQMEMFQNNSDVVQFNTLYKQLPTNKTLIAISPAYTMFNRMLSQKDWQTLVDILSKKYNILSFGNKETDFDLQNVIDLRSKVSINVIPKFLDLCEMVFSVNTGFLHIAGCSNTKIIMLNVGEFPSELIIPHRNNVLGYNSEIIEHDCYQKEECFQGHITESIFQKQCYENYKKYCNRFSNKLIQKYTAWHYCAKKKNKYICSKMIGKKIIEMAKNGKF